MCLLDPSPFFSNQKRTTRSGCTASCFAGSSPCWAYPAWVRARQLARDAAEARWRMVDGFFQDSGKLLPQLFGENLTKNFSIEGEIWVWKNLWKVAAVFERVIHQPWFMVYDWYYHFAYLMVYSSCRCKNIQIPWAGFKTLLGCPIYTKGLYYILPSYIGFITNHYRHPY